MAAANPDELDAMLAAAMEQVKPRFIAPDLSCAPAPRYINPRDPLEAENFLDQRDAMDRSEFSEAFAELCDQVGHGQACATIASRALAGMRGIKLKADMNRPREVSVRAYERLQREHAALQADFRSYVASQTATMYERASAAGQTFTRSEFGHEPIEQPWDKHEVRAQTAARARLDAEPMVPQSTMAKVVAAVRREERVRAKRLTDDTTDEPTNRKKI